MTTPRGGSPRLATIPEATGTCPVHGVVTFRIHKVGFTRHGAQKYRARCPECHAARETARRTEAS